MAHTLRSSEAEHRSTFRGICIARLLPVLTISPIRPLGDAYAWGDSAAVRRSHQQGAASETTGERIDSPRRRTLQVVYFQAQMQLTWGLLAYVVSVLCKCAYVHRQQKVCIDEAWKFMIGFLYGRRCVRTVFQNYSYHWIPSTRVRDLQRPSVRLSAVSLWSTGSPGLLRHGCGRDAAPGIIERMQHV